VAVDDFDDGYGDPSDYGMSQSDFDTATSIGQAVYSGNDDNIAQAIANATAQPRVGSNRSNITNLVDSSGNSLYDPQFAAALDISRGLDPTNNMGGTGGLAVPSYLRPQLTGANYVDYGDQDIYFDGPRDKVKYFSPVERFFQEDATNLIRSAQESGLGIPSLLGKGLDALLGGIDFLSNSKAGSKIEDVFEEQKKLQGPPLPPSQFDQFGNMVRSSIFDYSGNPTEPLSVVQNRRNKIEDLQQEASREAQLREIGFNPDFKTSTFPSITKTNLDPSFMNVDKTTAMDSGASLSTNPNVVITPDIDTFRRDIANASNAGITALSEAKPFSESINNQEIAAGAKKGSTLTDRELEDTANFADYLNRINKAKNEYGLYEEAMSQLFANRQKVLPKEVQSQYNENLYPKDVAYLNKLAEEENVARTVVDDLISLGPKRDFTSQNVNIIPDIFNKDGYTLENKYFSDIFTPKQVKEMQNKGYSLQGIENLRTPKQFPTKKTVPFSSLSDKLKEQYFLNTNLDYGAPIKTPYNVVY